MDRSVKRDIQRRYRKITETYSGSEDSTYCYTCDDCGHVVKVRQSVAGVVPMGIECPYCGGNAFCVEDGDTAPDEPVTHEWYRPTLDEVMEMVDEKMFTVNYVLGGGLMRRRCSRNCEN